MLTQGYVSEVLEQIWNIISQKMMHELLNFV